MWFDRAVIVASYTWDILHGGFPNEPLMAAMREAGHVPSLPPSASASRMGALRELWANADLEQIETREIMVSRAFRDFDDFWATSTLGTNVRTIISVDASGTITCSARANAIKGVVA